MPQNTTIPIEAAWELLTNANDTEITFQNNGNRPIYVIGTNGDTPAPTADFGVLYKPGEGELKAALGELFPGVSGVNRLWAKRVKLNSSVFVSHA